RDIRTHQYLSRWLLYQGVDITPESLRERYFKRAQEAADQTGECYPEIRVEEIFADICAESSIWKIDPDRLGVETARAFRAASIRRLGAIDKSRGLLDLFGATKKLGVVSNGQRVFSECELRALGLYDPFEFVIFSSDLGYKKPDPRIYAVALERMELHPPDVLFIGDTSRDDILAPRRIGMQALHVSEAWRRYGA
ncbi:MAG: HAD family hydrolase, partial [Methanomicrobiales archaeon]|nr:HAD family hydrolase [Methanomicrobiales archaeon]